MTNAVPPPASRREERRNSRRESILDVAARSFLELGYDGTTMSGIAGKLGGSKGTLWNYFPSKEVLFAAVIDRATIAFREQLSLILNPDVEPATALRRFCAEFLRKLTSPEAIALHRLVVSEASRFPEMGKIFYERAPRRMQLLLADYLTGAMARGLLRKSDPLGAAQQLLGLCMSGSHHRLLMGSPEAVSDNSIASDIDRATETFLSAYGAGALAR